MRKLMGLTAGIGFLAIVVGATGAAAQCVDSVGEAGAQDRPTALQQAYEAMLRGADQNAWRQWNAQGRRIGDAPGYSVRKLTQNCAPRGAAVFCRVSATLCR